MSNGLNQRRHMSYAEEIHARIEGDFVELKVPDAWHDIWREFDRRDGTTRRVTLRLDADVIRFFKAMGPGYQPRMNRVLRAFMHDRLAGLVAGPEDRVSDADLELARKLAAEIRERERRLARD